nr:hypothetical protein [uncultured Niameybacter sp.]
MKRLVYDPSLNKVTGSVTATLLFLQLEHWFKVTKGKPFYKFLEPCEYPHYRTGDSWTEELGFTKPEFRTAFSHIGKVYKSKKAYLESTDKFEGKCYLSYYDRMKRITYYMRNPEAIKELLRKHENILPSSRDKHSLQSINPYTIDLTIQPEEVLELFKAHCPSLASTARMTTTIKVRLNQLIAYLREKGENVLERLKEAFIKVEQSDYLCGRLAHSNWRALLSWILKPDKFLAILQDAYAPFVPTYKDHYVQTTSQFTSNSPPIQTNSRKFLLTFNRMENHNFDLAVLEAHERALQQSRYEDKVHNLQSVSL